MKAYKIRFFGVLAAVCLMLTAFASIAYAQFYYTPAVAVVPMQSTTLASIVRPKQMVSAERAVPLQEVTLKKETTASMVKVKAILRNLYEQMIAADSRMKTVKLYYDVDPV